MVNDAKTGRVISINDKGSWGKIQPDEPGNPPIFVHVNEIISTRGVKPTLEVGSRFAYWEGKDEQGRPQAKRVIALDGPAAEGHVRSFYPKKNQGFIRLVTGGKVYFLTPALDGSIDTNDPEFVGRKVSVSYRTTYRGKMAVVVRPVDD